MYVEPWIFWLILAPIAAVSAIYIGYLAFGLTILLGVYTLYALCQFWDGAAACTTWGLGWLVAPFRHYGPWFDYVAATGVLVALVGIVALLA